MKQIHELKHPLVQHHLAILRDRTTLPGTFRESTTRLAMLLGVYATEDLATRPVSVQTPLAPCPSHVLGVRVGLVPILRAGLGLIDPLLQLVPEAQVWHLGVYRNEETAEPVHYYDKIPESGPVDVALVLDPMLATGGSIRLTIDRLQSWGVPEIRVLSVIAAQEGLDRVQHEYPNVRVFVCAIDPELNHQQYIVPGLGDAGDRIFNTLP